MKANNWLDFNHRAKIESKEKKTTTLTHFAVQINRELRLSLSIHEWNFNSIGCQTTVMQRFSMNTRTYDHRRHIWCACRFDQNKNIYVDTIDSCVCMGISCLAPIYSNRNAFFSILSFQFYYFSFKTVQLTHICL